MKKVGTSRTTLSSSKIPLVQVLGAGPTGSLAALALSKEGFTVKLCDALPEEELKSRSRAYAINHSSRRILQKLELWEALKADLIDFDQLDLRDQVSKNRILFSLSDLSIPNRRYGAIGWIVDHKSLMNLLFQRLNSSPLVEIKLGSKAASPSKDSFVVAADGPRSTSRKYWSIGYWQHRYSQGCLTAKIAMRGIPKGYAFELFRKEGPLAILPLGEDSFQVVWSASLKSCQLRASMPSSYFLDQLAAILPDGVEPDLLIDKPIVFPQYLMIAHRLSHSKGVLIGESAHLCHPVGGQGLNLCWRDVETLISLVKCYGVSRRSATLYARKRWLDLLSVCLATDFLVRLFSNRIWILLPVRKLLMILMACFPALRYLSLKAMTDGPMQLLKQLPE